MNTKGIIIGASFNVLGIGLLTASKIVKDEKLSKNLTIAGMVSLGIGITAFSFELVRNQKMIQNSAK